MAAIPKPHSSPIPADDPARKLSKIDPDDPALRHVALVGDTYTILLSGADTAGKYCLIDMSVPRCGGPGPHRHDFEEMFHVLEGEVEFTFRGEHHVIKAGMTVNIPANAPHFFTNQQHAKLRMLCMCAPACQDDFFLAVGTPVASRTAPAPAQTDEQKAAFIKKAEALAPQYRTEMLKP
jgi:quercetin dioxygenase-like cupin family protein